MELFQRIQDFHNKGFLSKVNWYFEEDDEAVEVIGYGDLPKLWRRWLMLNVWFVGSFMIFALIYTTIFTSYNGVFEWFNIFWLYGFILLSGYFSLITIGLKYKKIKIASC